MLLKNLSIKVEIKIPRHFFIDNGVFSTQNMQNTVSLIVSKAVNSGRSQVSLLNHCDKLELIRFNFRKAFIDYLKNPVNAREHFGSSGGQVEFSLNYQSTPPNLTPNKIIPKFFWKECK